MLEKQKIDIESRDKDGKTPLHHATKAGNEAVIRYLVQQGADVGARSGQGYHALYYLILKQLKSLSLFNLLIDKGASPEALDGDGCPTIVRAAEHGLTSVVRLLANKDVDIASVNKKQQTALDLAAGKGHVDTIRVLLELGAEVDHRDQFGFTPLLHATYCGHQASISILMDNGADVKAVSLDGRNAVDLALSKGQKAIASLILDKQPHFLNDKDSEGQLAIHRAARAGKDDVINILLEKGADLEYTDDQGRTALMYAVSHNQKQTASLLLQKGANVNAVNKEGRSPIFFAAWNGNQTITIEWLLDNGASIDQKDALGETLLHRACASGKLQVVKYLLERGAEKDPRCDGEITPLLKAIGRNHISTAKAMIAAGCNLSLKSKDPAFTPLLCAATWTNSVSLVSLLLESGANIEDRDNQELTPLGRAALNGKEAVLKFLLEKKANVNARDRWGQTPLQRVVRAQLESSVRMLLDTRADLVAKDDIHGMATIHYAAVWNTSATITGLLLDKGCLIEDRDINGSTPLFLAAAKNRSEVFKLLVERGADVEAKDKSGHTPLMRAVAHQLDVMVRHLLESGADVGAHEEKTKMQPLHIAASTNNSDSVVSLLLDSGAQMEARDEGK